MSETQFFLGTLATAFERRLSAWREADAVSRLWAKDRTLWSPQPVPELTDRLGWLHLPASSRLELPRLVKLAGEVREEGVRRVVLAGMGGSSLAPELFQHTFGNREGCPDLVVLDTTHPDGVAELLAHLDLARTLVLVSSKSGSTIEMLSLFAILWERMAAAVAEPGGRFVAITDPGTSLQRLAQERGFRGIFNGVADVGGRFSALSVFGLVPAALIGVDVERLLASAEAMAAACARAEDNPGLELGAALAELALGGRDKLTFVAAPPLGSLPDWLEQLVAESTGKHGRGIVPVVGEPLADTAAYGADRAFVGLAVAGREDAALLDRLDTLQAAGHPVLRLVLADPFELGGELFRWEVAVALAGSALGINPFDQPDVQLAKELARRAMGAGAGPTKNGHGERGEPVARLLEFLASARPGDYLAVQAFLGPNLTTGAQLARLQRRLRDRLRLAVTVGYGPRFLHSTGQLHKGGADNGLFLQLVDRPRVDLGVPGSDYTLARLVAAQARGDMDALASRGRRVLRLDLGGEPVARLAELVDRLA